MAKVIVLDTETTGMDPSVDRLVELAAVGVDKPEEQFETLIDPLRDIPPEAKAIHHITEEMCQRKPCATDATYNMLELFGSPEVIVAHNAKFDRGFMELLWPADYSPKWICTYKCALKLMPEAPAHSNQVLRYWLGLEPELPEGLAPHRALYDILVTREIFQSLLTLATINELYEISSKPVLLEKVTFGKHKGARWSEVDRGYLSWCVRQADMNEDVVFTARYHLERR